MRSAIRANKTLVIFLAAFLVLVNTLNITQAFAAPLKFADISHQRYDWARPYIEKMALMGVIAGKAQNTFAPDDPVKRVEFIAMIVRLLGLDEELENKDLPPDFPKAYSVPVWARGYVAVAVEKGIISGQDYADFRPEDPAKRYEAAVFAVKALGFEEEARALKTINLSFKDIYAIPLDARNYVQVAVEKGILSGFEDNTFKPGDGITRAQAAKVLNQMAEFIDAGDRIVVGEVESIQTLFLQYIDVRLADGSRKTYNVGSDAQIYRKDRQGRLNKITLKDISAGETVMIIAEDSNALYLEATSSEITAGETVEGTLKTVDTAGKFVIFTKKDGGDLILSIDSGTRVYIDGRLASTADLVPGQPASVLISENRVVKIEARGEDKTAKGLLKAVVSNSVIIENEDTGNTETYAAGAAVTVIKDGKTAALSQLLGGDMVTLVITGSKVTKIEAESAEKKITGTVKTVSFLTRNPVITVKAEDGTEEDYEVDGDADITKNGKPADIKSIKSGDEVTLYLKYRKVVDITAKSVRRDINGMIKEISLSSISKVIITDDEGLEHSFVITQDTKITRDRKKITVFDLKPNFYVEMEVEGDEVIEMDVTARQVLSTLTGTVQYIHKDARVIVVELRNVEGSRVTKEIHYTSDTTIMKGGREVSTSRITDYIEEGDEIIAVGRYESGLFFADVVIDLVVSY
ncbi:S-layer homology domain-containing protein [Thermosediminibacter litoriperuensis]|uniref:S-layer family protein n=1 Tax=Thermosediminibacter litoriperuensis TaxID=291989 RepID=A0A5S5AH28_9FIRM|nr:S-layer homology domain-containing protein [Thermosediminibacter litoriperuensis]TYP49774.1 S-layer family protein [Thermosediminibacter litoriperuensis]